MKALSIKIQAFGPFDKTHEVDFRLFGENSIYLINGNTGSGKTTILDAISFALYGDTTGKDREANDMRCDYANEKLVTEVVFEFQLGEKTYRIQRMPKQEIKKVRGEGFTSKGAEATLWEITDDGSLDLLVPRKVGEINEKIVELIGLNSQQFRQVMVLPQGRFRELLLADSKNREAIFSQLFQTQIYKQIEDDIRAQAKDVEHRIAEFNTKKTGILEMADVNSEEEVGIRLGQLLPEHAELQDKKQQATEAHKVAIEAKQSAMDLYHQFEGLKIKQAELKTHQDNQPTMDTLKVAIKRSLEADKLNPIFEQLQTLKNDKTLLETKLKKITATCTEANVKKVEAENRFISADQDNEKLQSLSLERDKLQRIQGFVDDLTLAKAKLGEAKSNEQKSSENLSVSLSKISQLKQAYQENESRQEALTEILREEPQIQIQLNEFRNKIILLQELQAKEAALKQKEIEGLEAKNQVEEALKQFQTAQDSTKRLEVRWHLGQAAILAESLQDEQACPVCGSNEHPAPAVWTDSEGQVDEAQLEESKRVTAEYQQAHAKAENHLTALRSEHRTMKSALIGLEEKLEGKTVKDLEGLQQKFKELNATLADIEQAKQSLTELQNTLNGLKEQLLTLEADIKRQESEVNECKTQTKLKEQACHSIDIQIPEVYCVPEKLNAELKALEGQILTIRQTYETARTAFDDAKSNADKTQQSLENTQEQLQNLTQKHSSSELQWAEALNNSNFNNEVEFKTALSTKDDTEHRQQKVQAFEDKLNKLNGAIEQFNSTLRGKSVPNLEDLIEKLKKASAELELADAAFNELDKAVSTLNSAKEKLKVVQKENQKLIEEHKVIGTLSEVLSGKEGDKVNLQRFVLSLLLNDVLDVASQHLRTMSRGRYLLVRKEERSKGNKASGLDLQISDTWNDSSRGVATLSGGESFMAALSLALGLSDVVQSYSGGIKLDTLFIDEGFGSLDPESLELAIETLQQLQANGRSIGIISHVAELKEQMAKRIDVHSSNSGSTIKMIA
ncbi:MAG: SMC family ATPase [Pseudomonadota bacterium]|nr:SMC family ATPase [Pseudomonadota bacterium]